MVMLLLSAGNQTCQDSGGRNQIHGMRRQVSIRQAMDGPFI
jgi:hypothetical protein